jgi:hypothetical protein
VFGECRSAGSLRVGQRRDEAADSSCHKT